MESQKDVMVFVEHQAGAIADVSRELISEAVALAQQVGGRVTAGVVGHGLATPLADLGQFGCETVYSVDDPRLERFTSVPYAKAMVAIVRQTRPKVVLYGATTTGRDIAPRIASALKCGLTADCTELRIGEHRIKKTHYPQVLLQIRPAFGGNIIATIVSPDSHPSMATVREGVMRMIARPERPPAEVVPVPCDLTDDDFPTDILETVRAEKCVDLKGPV
jgi:electron transfer flavoprotein alpha subunit